MSDVAAVDSKAKDAAMEVYEVPEGKRISLGAPSLLALSNGKLLAAFDQTGPDVKGLPGKRGHDAKRNRWMQGVAMSSADGGATWQRVATYPYRRASLFRDGGDVYLLGEASGGLWLMRSPDGGASWSAPMELTGDLDLWLSPTRVAACGDFWTVPCLVPAAGDVGLCVWRAPRGASLMNRKAWTQGPVSPPLSHYLASSPSGGCGVPWAGSAPAWRHPVAVAVADPGHPWHEPGGAVVLCSASCGREHWGTGMRIAPADGSVAPLAAGGEAPWHWVALPGGHAKFEGVHDASSNLYWLAGSRGTPGLAAGRDAGREASLRRVGVWASDNLVDWQFAGSAMAGGEGAPGVRCDPSLAIAGGDLYVACRAGGPASRNPRETSRIVCARMEGFRSRWA
jgi:hypothetical protein